MMLSQLGGNQESLLAWNAAQGKEIAALAMESEALVFTFTDGTKVQLFDDGQNCCESRYMTTDDDLGYYVGATLLDADVADAPSIDNEYDVHEVQFLKVTTSKGVFTMETHNEHNGYYGGFVIVVNVLDGDSGIGLEQSN